MIIFKSVGKGLHQNHMNLGFDRYFNFRQTSFDRGQSKWLRMTALYFRPRLLNPQGLDDKTIRWRNQVASNCPLGVLIIQLIIGCLGVTIIINDWIVGGNLSQRSVRNLRSSSIKDLDFYNRFKDLALQVSFKCIQFYLAH